MPRLTRSSSEDLAEDVVTEATVEATVEAMVVKVDMAEAMEVTDTEDKAYSVKKNEVRF